MRTNSRTISAGQRGCGRLPGTLRERIRRIDASGEDGLLLIEVLVSAMLVALISIGTFSGIEASNRIQHTERARAQATTLAEQDEERLRSLTSAQLANLSEEKTTTFQKTKYTIVSKAEFVSDTSGEASCSSASASADYFKTSSEVTWTGIGPAKNVVQTGLVSPPAGGELMVLVEDGRGGKVSGMSVTGTGKAALSGTTGSSGCVIFGPLEEGTYEVNATQAGFVGVNGETEVPSTSRSASVTGQTTQTKTFEFNKAGKLEATLQTAPASLGPAQALNVVAAQTGFTNGVGFRQLLPEVETAYSLSPIASGTTFFPFSSPYSIYAGTCAANAPANFGGTNQSAQLEPGGTTKATVTEPGLVVVLWEGTSSTKKNKVGSPEIWLKDTDTGAECTNTAFKVKTVASPKTVAEGGKGDLESPGLPYGKYTVCAYFLKGSTKYHAVKENITNSNTEIGTTVELFQEGGSSEVKTGWTCP